MISLIVFLTYVILLILMFTITKIRFFNKRFYRFILTGVCNTLNYTILFVFLDNKYIYIYAHLISFLISAFLSYFITCYYTFSSKPSIKSFLSFPLTFLPNLLGSTLFTFIFVELNIISQDLASIFIMLCSVPVTFVINKFVFKK